MDGDTLKLNDIRTIHGLSQDRRLPRLGAIRIGEKVAMAGGKTRPQALDHFDFGEEALRDFPAIADIYADPETGAIEPKALDVLLPSEDIGECFPQAYMLYGAGDRLKCKGNGERAIELVCSECGKLRCGHKTAERVEHERACPCEALDGGGCKPVGRLQVVLYRVTWCGVFQIRTSSWNSLRDLNSGIDAIRDQCGRLAWIPLKVHLVEQSVKHGKQWTKKHILKIGLDVDPVKVRSHLARGEAPIMLIEAPVDEETEPETEPETASHHEGQEEGDKLFTDPDPMDGEPSGPPGAPPAHAGITDQQLRMIEELHKALGLTKDDWKWLLDPYGVDGVGKLTAAEACDIIEALTKRAKEAKAKAK